MPRKRKIIFICTGNSCRSQIAHALLKDLASDKFEVYSAGSLPSKVHSASIAIMDEVGIDISNHTSDLVDDFLGLGMDIAITVCDNANQVCPVFPGEVKRIHWSIKDPFKKWSFCEKDLDVFRDTREEIKKKFLIF